MEMEPINILKYEYIVHPGAYFNVETPWITDPRQMKTVIIDQDHVFTKMLTIYPHDTHPFLMFLEQCPDRSIYRTNYPLVLNEHRDSYHIDFDAT